MIGKFTITNFIAAGAFAVALTVGQDVRADGAGIEEVVTPLLTTPLIGVDGKGVIIAHIIVPPGFVTTKHHHPGQLFLYVVEGAVTIELEGEAPVKLGPGDLFQETPGQVMVGKNLSTTHGAELVIFQIGDVGAPLQVDAE